MFRCAVCLLILFVAHRTQGEYDECPLRYFGRHRTNQSQLVNMLLKYDYIEDTRVSDVMFMGDRKHYVVKDPYGDFPQRIGYGAVVSPPYMDAYFLAHLVDWLTPGKTVLQIAPGAGYLMACMARKLGPTGLTVGLHHRPSLAVRAEGCIRRDNATLLKRIKFVVGDLRQGYPALGPYDVIHVGAPPDKVPYKYFDQLAPGGRLLIPIIDLDGKRHRLLAFDKGHNGAINSTYISGTFYDSLHDKLSVWPYPPNCRLDVP